MTYSFIACEDGVDTVALQSRCPEFFNVTDKDGVACWTLRPDVHAVLHASLDDAARRNATFASRQNNHSVSN